MMTVMKNRPVEPKKLDTAAMSVGRADSPGYTLSDELVEAGALDELFAKNDAGAIELTGCGG